ncbi:MAG: hypothetical protein PHY73_05535 [Candidatus Omnitrophica bacterium]|nr:hypothetical protein [Candidatus Omnitrophota bacterium]
MKKFFYGAVVLLFFCGCAATLPKDMLKLSDESLKNREQQMRQYETTDEEKILVSSATVLQDLGFIIDDTETELGFIATSKSADATNAGQIAGAFFIDMLAALGGNASASATKNCDKEQKVRASIIVKPSNDKSKMVVRITFQRIVWNQAGLVSRFETIRDEEMYQTFFDKLSKSIFLEEQQI